MFHFSGPRWAVLTALGVALSANAQQPATPTQPANTPTAAQGGDLSYRSTLDGYQKYTDEKVGSWRDANDNVGRIGGWREYAKEAQGGQSQGQGGHGAHGGAAPPAQGGATGASGQGGQATPAARPADAGGGSHSGHGKN